MKHNARQRQKAYLKELLAQNFLKKYSHKLNGPNPSLVVSHILAQEIEKFLDSQ